MSFSEKLLSKVCQFMKIKTMNVATKKKKKKNALFGEPFP